jgi:hypothetical protein
MRSPFAALALACTLVLCATSRPASAQLFGTGWSGAGQLLGYADLDNDGDLELVVRTTDVKPVHIVDSGTGATLYELPSVYGGGISTVQLFADEYDGTQFPEMVVLNTAQFGNTTLGMIGWNGSAYVEQWRRVFEQGVNEQFLLGTGRFVPGVQHLVLDYGVDGFVLRRPSDGASDYDWKVEHPGVGVDSYQLLNLDDDGLQQILVQAKDAQNRFVLYVVRPTGTLAVPGEQAFTSTKLVLGPNAPNPFARETEIAFEMPRRDRAVVRVFDPAGRLVRTVLDGTLGAGRQRVAWDGRDEGGHPVSSGTYFLDIAVNGDRQTRKMVRLE